MRAIISYPLPFDNWDPYWRSVQRFTDTFKKYPPGCDYEVWAVCNWGEPTDEVREWFYGIKTRFIPYYESGCDLGGHQHVADTLGNQDAFVIGMTSRCFFYRAGWLERLVKIREEKGAGLFFTSASKQGGRLHGCTRAFSMDAFLWRVYPQEINSRLLGPYFEVGLGNPYGNLLEWHTKHEERIAAWLVHWDDVFELPAQWDRYLAAKNRFRDGNQEQMLVHDYHTDLYRDASPEKRLEMQMQFRGVA